MQVYLRFLSTFALALLLTLNAGLADALNLYVTGDTVNLRESPSTSSKVIGSLKYRQVLSHLGKSGAFIKVKTTSGAIGYVSSTYVSTTAPAPRVAQRSAPVAQQGYTVWINTNSGVYHNSGCRWYGNTNSGTYANVNEAWGRACKKCGG